MSPIYTIGHSNHSWHEFLRLLQQHAISAVCDVRSSPYSRFCPQFNREAISDSLRVAGVVYIFLGAELGGRPREVGFYENGKVCYERIARSDIFRRGIARLREERAVHRVALMCAERDPLRCHRALLVARELCLEKIPVRHILADGSLQTENNYFSQQKIF